MEDSKKTCDISKADVPDSSGSKDLSKSLPEEAFNNFLQGKRSMLVQDYSFAVQSLAQACEMYVDHFGELAMECAEVYLLYGKALFRLSQQQAGVLGGALNEGSNEEETSESDSNENENETDKNSDGEEGEENEAENEGEANEAENKGEEDEAENEEENEPEKEPSESTDSPQAVIDEGSSDVKAENPEAKGEASEASKSAEPSNKDESKTDTADEQAPISEGSKVEGSMEENTEVEQEDDLELAWNTLETAKSIFKRKDTVEAQLKVAEILQLLAEISMESDNNAQAISDLNECLEIQKKHLKPDDRILAETYYQKGLALMLDKIYPAALENFNATKKILELRVENLKNTKVDDADGTFASADLQIEISDLEAILLDIKEKIDDTEELITNKKKEQEELTEEPIMFSSPIKETDVKSSPAKPVSNITHLLKRKKPDEGTSADSAKRIKVTTVVNGETNVTETEAKKAEG